MAVRRNQSASYIDGPMEASGGTFDLVLVDGRFRAACALKVLQHATARTRVVMHDFTTHRASGDSYRAVLEWYQLVARNGSLVVLRPRPSSVAAAQSCYGRDCHSPLEQLAGQYRAALATHMLNFE